MVKKTGSGSLTKTIAMTQKVGVLA